jgi:3-methyladenine DNA glycosylase AlkD
MNMRTLLKELKVELRSFAKNERICDVEKFFKTAPGQYAAFDKFLGVNVPTIRILSKKFQALNFLNLRKIIRSEFHEERLLALFILVLKYNKTEDIEIRKEVFEFYLENLNYVNNWDLVDASSYHILGAYLYGQGGDVQIKLSQSKNLWYRRIAIVSTFYEIKRKKFSLALRLSYLLLNDSHDLLHKAVGWMLREIGKRDMKTEESFLEKYCELMPATMLRYATEHFPEDKRQSLLFRRRSYKKK